MLSKWIQNSQTYRACVSVNLNELAMRHVPAVECLLVVHKARKFSLFDFLAAQHQHSGGERWTRGILHTLRSSRWWLFESTRHSVSVAAQINNSPRLAHKRQHEHVVRFSACLRAQRPQTCMGDVGRAAAVLMLGA